MSDHPTRTEHDLIGKLEVPSDACCGVQTARAMDNNMGATAIGTGLSAPAGWAGK